jgi:hypothetical protein
MTHLKLTPNRTNTHSTTGFWIVAVAFATAMAFTTVPTPLWSLYAQHDGFSSLTIASTRVSLLVFAGLLALATAAATPALLGGSGTHPSSYTQPTSA